MCTIGYIKKLNLIFKNRDKNTLTQEVIAVRPEFMAVKTEGADYFCSGINMHGCGFVSTAVNTPRWTDIASKGDIKQAERQSEIENQGLINPSVIVSESLDKAIDADALLDSLLNASHRYMGYNILVADKKKVFHIELHDDQSHVTRVRDNIAITNHFKHLAHGPRNHEDYLDSYERLYLATSRIPGILSLEDLFFMLKPAKGDNESRFWRHGHIHTVSSSVIDLDVSAIYYADSVEREYKRISGSIPPKGAEKTHIEMSRYIDLHTYHNIERGHPYYEEMLAEIHDQIREFHHMTKHSDRKLQTLELGSGTGIFSIELVTHPFLEVNCLDIDSECCEILKNHAESSSYKVINNDAVLFCRPEKFDLIISTFAHDHIHYDRRFVFAKNIYNNLKEGGRYIMGGELLPYFSNDVERKKSLFIYHNFIIDMALKENRVQLSELENNALKSGLDMIGDFKRHEAMFEHEMQSAGLRLIQKKKMGPLDRHDVGGVFVYVYER